MPLLDKVTRGHDLQMTSDRKDESNWSDTHRHVYFDPSSFVIKVTNITYLQEQYRHTLSNSLQFTSSDTHQEHLLKYLTAFDSVCLTPQILSQTSCVSTMKCIGTSGYFTVHAHFSSFYIYIAFAII